MVTKFESEYGNSDLQRNRGKYENRPDLKKGEKKREKGREREGVRKWRGDGRRTGSKISSLNYIVSGWHVPHRSGNFALEL